MDNKLLLDLEKIVDNSEVISIDKALATEVGLKASVIMGCINNLMKNNDDIITISKLVDTVPCSSEKLISSQLNKLKKAGYIAFEKFTPYEIQNILSKKHLDGRGIGDKTCPWCNGKTIVLHEHHFPVPKSLGGTDTIFICPGCHYEYHHLVTIRVVKKVIK